jgi:hypothetical protein
MADLSLDEIGLGSTPRSVIYAISILPLVGFVIGANYAVRRNTATRRFGRRLLRYAVAVHVFYTLCVCPAVTIVALR